MSGLGFGGEVAELYQRYRRGYPPPVIDALIRGLRLTAKDTLIDLGCGTGQLTLPLARRIGHVLAVDIEPDMLERGNAAARKDGIDNVTWMIGTDKDLSTIGNAGESPVAAITIAQALHWMDAAVLFADARQVLRPGGGIAVVTNGSPLWQQDNSWSQALHRFLESWSGKAITGTCGTDDESQRRYRRQLEVAGYTVSERHVDYSDELTVDQLTGGVLSAIPLDELPVGERRAVFIEGLTVALPSQPKYREEVRVTMLLAMPTA